MHSPVNLSAGKRLASVRSYLSASPTVSTYTSFTFTPASSTVWMMRKVDSSAVLLRLVFRL